MADDTPHDKLFFKMFSLPDNAGGALRAVLPRQIVQAADWSTLKLRGSRFVDSELKGSQSDLLFEVAVGESKVLLYLLFEHQSTDDALMPYRLLRYMIRIWEQWIAEQQEHPKLLPAIVPVVMSHSEGGWRRAVSMHELFDPLAVQAAGEHLPGFRFVLDDLTMRSNGELMARAASDLATLATLFLKNVRDAPDLGALFMQWSPLLQRVFA
ncbi:MAG: Rpn family recombination-promoting nuclease/putative transposase, partial [Deltaproteobacteria bacterium]|nr:Rpn family recombination-promoting nuclease/putative transposase [Deltaproteobacteria bacterium]